MSFAITSEDLKVELNEYNSMELNLLMFTYNIDKAFLFREKCLKGSQYMLMLNNIMKDGKLFYSTLCDMSEIKIFKKDFLGDFNGIIHITEIAPIFKFNEILSISMRIFKLYEKGLTFYESYGYIPINVNLRKPIDGLQGKDIFYMDDYLNLSDEYSNYHISHYTKEDGDFNENKGKLKEYMKDIKTLRQSIKNFPINLKLLNEDADSLNSNSDDEGEEDADDADTKVAELILELRYIPDIEGERILLDKAIKEFEQYKILLRRILKNNKDINGSKFTMNISELINTLIKDNPSIYNINGFDDTFVYNKAFGQPEEYFKFMESYLSYGLINLSKNIDLMELKMGFKFIVREDFGTDDKQFYSSLTKRISEEIDKIKVDPDEDLQNEFANIKKNYLQILKKTLESRTYFTQVEKEAITKFITEDKNDVNSISLIEVLYSVPETEKSTEFNKKVELLKRSVEVEVKDYQNTKIQIQEIIDIIKRSEQDYIIKVDDFCQCITSLWNIFLTIMKQLKQVTLAILEPQKKLMGEVCIMILNIFFNKTHPDYCGEFFGLLDGEPSILDELNYLIDTSETSTIRYNDYFYDSGGTTSGVKSRAEENKLYDEWLTIERESKLDKLDPLSDINKYIIDKEGGTAEEEKKGKLIISKKNNKLFYRIPNTPDNCFTLCIYKDGNPTNLPNNGGGRQIIENIQMGGSSVRIPRLPSIYNNLPGFLTLITQSAILLSRKFLTIQKYMDGNQTESYQDLIKQSKLTDIMENQIEIDDVYTKEDFLLGDQSINKIRCKTYHKLFRMLYSRYSVKEDRFKLNKNGKNKLHKSEALREYLKSHLDIYLREILSKPKLEKKIKFYKFLKREYGLK